MFRICTLLAISFAVMGFLFADCYNAALSLYALAGLTLAMGDECEPKRKQR